MYPKYIQNLIDEFVQFPGVGPKTAQRFVFYLIKKSPRSLESFIKNIKLAKTICICSVCGNFSTQNICDICSNKRRDKFVITLVSGPQDLITIENIGEYSGLYHILGELINTVRNIGPEKLRIKQLLKRLKQEPIKELIFALNSTIEGESTLLYIINLIKKHPDLYKKIKLTKIARGLPLGAEIEYADDITLSDAIKHRKIV